MEWVAGVGRGVTVFTMQCEKVSVVAHSVNYGDDTINAQNTPTQQCTTPSEMVFEKR